MYTITRKSRIQDTLMLERADGTSFCEILVDINVDSFIGRYNRARETLKSAQDALSSCSSAENMQYYGECVIALLQLVFGEYGAAKILEFYENQYVELLLDVFPFIRDVVTPQVNAASEERVRQLRDAAGISNGKRNGKRIR